MKLVLVVRTDLDMGRGKIAAQVAHAAVTAALRGGPAVAAWVADGQPKVVLRAGGQDELGDLVRAAKAAGLPVAVIRDAGRTQVAAGTPTCCAIGPAESTRLDEITGNLRLL